MSLGRLGPYEILDRIGEGGMGVVFRARDTRLDRVLALKVVADELAANPEYRARLLREARAEASLNHPSIATCFEVGEGALDPPDATHPGHPVPDPKSVPYLAMEYVPGEDLLELIRRRPLAHRQVLDLAIQVAHGLDAAHRSGIVHRDLKPANVRITPEGRAKILDFGLARVRADSQARTAPISSFQSSEGTVVGTAHYMAPEQAQGHPADARCDLYSFGVLLYQMISGRLPFEGGSAMEVFYAVANQEPSPLARYARGVPDEMERIVRKLLARRPDDRYQSAHEVATDLERLRDAAPVRARGGMRALRPRVLVGAAILAAVVAVALWAARGLLEPPSHNIAVLPFDNASGDSSLAYVSGGIANAVRGDLVDRTDLNVVSRRSSEGVPAGERRASVLAREVGAGSILSGTLRKDNDGLRLDVELVNAPSGYVRWSASYPFTAVDALRIQRDILENVTGRLAARRTDTGRARAGSPTQSVTAYDAYLQGERFLDDADDPEAPDHASEAFGRALVLDPQFALAWAERSRALFRIYSRERSPETLRSAEQAAARSLELEPGLLEGHIARAQIYRGTSRTQEAITEIQQVIHARPTWDEGWLQLAATYRNAGRLDLAESSYRRATELRPDDWRNWNSLGALLIKKGDYAGARAAFEKIVTLSPDKNRGYEQLAAVAMMQNDFERAAAIYRRLPTPVEDAPLANNVANAYFYTGRLKEAQEYFALAVRLQPANPAYRRNLGDAYERDGRGEEAKACYREAVRLLDSRLEVEPGNVDLRLDRALSLAKSGDCDEARTALRALEPKIPGAAAAYAYTVAMTHGVCGDRREAISALQTAIHLGASRSKARDEQEFRVLRDDPAFQQLTAVSAAADSSHPNH